MTKHSCTVGDWPPAVSLIRLDSWSILQWESMGRTSYTVQKPWFRARWQYTVLIQTFLYTWYWGILTIQGVIEGGSFKAKAQTHPACYYFPFVIRWGISPAELLSLSSRASGHFNLFASLLSRHNPWFGLCYDENRITGNSDTLRWTFSGQRARATSMC